MTTLRTYSKGAALAAPSRPPSEELLGFISILNTHCQSAQPQRKELHCSPADLHNKGSTLPPSIAVVPDDIINGTGCYSGISVKRKARSEVTYIKHVAITLIRGRVTATVLSWAQCSACRTSRTLDWFDFILWQYCYCCSAYILLSLGESPSCNYKPE